MNDWTPALQGREGPKYRAIADALEADMATGSLAPGDRLPTHRDLAWRLKVTVGTVSRAYAEAERRGLVAGEIGRGTFVRDRETHTGSPGWIATADRIDDDAGPIRLHHDFPPPGDEVAEAAEALRVLAAGAMLPEVMAYQPHAGMARHRTAAATWVARRGLDVDPEDIVISSGAHNGVVAALASLTRPGDRVATEETCYPGIKGIAHMLGLTLVPLPLDAEGMRPEALEEACRVQDIRAVYCVPTLQNPTNATMSEERRRAIAGILRRHDLMLVEDDIFGVLPENAPPALSTYAPDHSILVTSISKSLAPGLRIGFVAGRCHAVSGIVSAVRTSSWMASPLCAEIFAGWIETGADERILASHRRELAARRAIARTILTGHEMACPDGAMHGWLTLPAPWRSEEFVQAAEARDVVLPPSSAFTIGRGETPHAVRVSFGPPRSRTRFQRGVETLAEILERVSPTAALEVL